MEICADASLYGSHAGHTMLRVSDEESAKSGEMYCSFAGARLHAPAHVLRTGGSADIRSRLRGGHTHLILSNFGRLFSLRANNQPYEPCHINLRLFPSSLPSYCFPLHGIAAPYADIYMTALKPCLVHPNVSHAVL